MERFRSKVLERFRRGSGAVRISFELPWEQVPERERFRSKVLERFRSPEQVPERVAERFAPKELEIMERVPERIRSKIPVEVLQQTRVVLGAAP